MSDDATIEQAALDAAEPPDDGHMFTVEPVEPVDGPDPFND